MSRHPLPRRHAGARLLPLATLLSSGLLAACGGNEGSAATVPAGASRAAAQAVPKSPDHDEFSASLQAPFAGEPAAGARDFTLRFEHPSATGKPAVHWTLQVLGADGQALSRWQGVTALGEGGRAEARVHWVGRSGALAGLADGHYRVRLDAREVAPGTDPARAPVETQAWDIRLGRPAAPQLPAFSALQVGGEPAALPAAAADGHAHTLSVPATGSLPYTVWYGNLHSQTNDSDGGGNVATCTGSQNPQAGQYGPADAFAYAKSAGLDLLVASEHNHYFDGSTGTNAGGSASAAKARYQAGLATAASFNNANPGFLAVYGMEWGVISNGGHLNIFNSSELFSWEYNSSNQLFGDRFTAKSDYPAVYATMKAQGLVGQFNHPAATGQFLVGGTPLGYSADGDEVMVLAEVLNTSAFSANTTETETGLDSYEPAFNILLERGYHVAPSTDQDNHCANWGRSSTNRTGLLIPTGTALTPASFVEALRARRVFATLDKNAQIVLTANGHLMGERFASSGPLSLSVGYASRNGHTASTVQIFEGVPGRNGTVTVLASSGTATVTPAAGNHFYYAKITQDDGKLLWSAPVWVTQGTGAGDSTPPVVTAAESGTSGSISLSATATDNVGVSRVDFLVDGVLKGSDTTAPYSLALDSTTLANGSHSLVAKAVDAAGNTGSSAAVAFSVSNVVASFKETESNGTIATANVPGNAVTITGTMGTASDKDYFKLSLAANQKLRVDMTGPAANDYDLYLVDAADVTLVSSTGSTSTESISYTNGATAKTVYIKVVSYSGSSSTQTYTLTVSHP